MAGGLGFGGHVDVHAEHLGEQRLVVLAVAVRVVLAAAVAHADEHGAVGGEGEQAAVVVREGLVDREQDVLAVGVGDVGIGADRVARDDRVAGVVRVVHEEAAVVLVVGMERDAEQSALAAAAHQLVDVEERRLEQHAVLDDADGARLLDDEEAVRIEARRGDVHRQAQAVGDQDGSRRDAGERRDAGARIAARLELAGGVAAVAGVRVAVVALLVRSAVPSPQCSGPGVTVGVATAQPLSAASTAAISSWISTWPLPSTSAAAQRFDADGAERDLDADDELVDDDRAVAVAVAGTCEGGKRREEHEQSDGAKQHAVIVSVAAGRGK